MTKNAATAGPEHCAFFKKLRNKDKEISEGFKVFWFLLILCGGLGVICRYFLVTSLNLTVFPLGVFLANISGSLLIGWLFFSPTLLGQPLRLAIMVGFLGALTTFSSFSLDILLMLEKGRVGLAMTYWFLSNASALGACWLGMRLAKSL